MTDELMKKMYGKISTEKFNSIKNTLGISALSASFLTMISNVPVIDYSLLPIFILNYSSFYLMCNYNAIDFTKSYKDLEDEYKLFLNNYRGLMNSLDINSIASLCGSFYYLYKNGYLTIDGHFDLNSKNYFEGRRYQLVNIFNGCGVCRHKANSLKDILNFCGYETAGIPIYTRVYEKYTEEDIANMKKYFLNLFDHIDIDKDMIDFVTDSYINMQVLVHQFDLDNEKNSEDYSEEKKKLSMKVGNHLTVITSDGSESIVYDPTDNCFYQLKDKKSCDVINEFGMRVEYRLRYLGRTNTPSEEKILFRNLKLHPMSLEGLRESQIEAELKIKANLDIIDKFKKDNLPLMHSLRDKAYKLVL